MEIRSTLVELFSRFIDVNEKTNIYNNGSDNNYPERIERVVNNSTTAKNASNKMASYIFGKGFTNGNEIANKTKGLTYNDILYLISNSIKYHKGFYLHITHGIDLLPNSIDVLPYKNCRISKDDDFGNKNAIYYSEKWGEKKFSFNQKSKKAKWFYPYNDLKDVIVSQMENDAKQLIKDDDTEVERSKKLVENYRGQVLFVNLEPENIYPLAFIDSAYNDADSEYRTSIYKNSNLRNGFIGKMVATVLQSGSKKDKIDIENNLSELIGSENTGNLLVFESKLDQDNKLIPVIRFDEVKSNNNDKMFKYTEESIKESILMSYGIHPSLIIPSNSLFGTNDSKILEIKKDFQESLHSIRTIIEMDISKLYGKKVKIIKLIDDANK